MTEFDLPWGKNPNHFNTIFRGLQVFQAQDIVVTVS
jgi:hypothetical protein